MSQILLPRTNGDTRVVAREVLINTDAVRSVIIQGAPNQLYSIIELSSQEGMNLMDYYLEKLYLKGIISKETLKSRIRDKDFIRNIK